MNPQAARHAGTPRSFDAFEETLSVSAEEIEFTLRGLGTLPCQDYWLNPRRLRGSDFLMRWSQGVWSEHRLTEAINASARYRAIPYGPSSVAPEQDIRAHELYFERLEAAGLGTMKRPDLLIFEPRHEAEVRRIIENLLELADEVLGVLDELAAPRQV